MYFTQYAIFFTLLVAQVTSGDQNFEFSCLERGIGEFSANSTYKINLFQALSNLTQSSQELNAYPGFYKSSYGQIPDKVHAVGLCRGDVEPEICHTCLEKSSNRLTEHCPNEKEAIGGFRECVLHYSNRSSTGLMETHPRAFTGNNQSTSTNYKFLQSLHILYNNLRNSASKGGPFGKYSSGKIQTGLGFDTIYAVAQCTPDLTENACIKCLDEVFVDVSRFEGMLGWRVITPSCNFRFEIYLFYGLVYSPPPPVSLTNTTSRRESTKSFGTGGLAVSAASVVLIISVGVYTRMKRTNTKADNVSSEVAEEIGCVGYLKFDFSTIKLATNNFSVHKKIGDSSVGTVYKGTLRKGQDIAVKCVDSKLHRVYFRNEILCGSKLFHRNLVKLLGFCSKGDASYLVYEFLPKKLDCILFDQPLYRRVNLDWDKRFMIINGLARALLYLHEDSGLRIAHGDIRSSKIMLDEKLNPIVSCFQSAYISNRDMRSDIFGFGVLILELITRQTSKCHTEPFINYVWMNWKRKTTSNIIDQELIRDNCDLESIIRCVHIALLCVQDVADSRPKMSSIVLMLNSISLTLPNLSELEEALPSQSENNGLESDELLSSSNSFVSATETLSSLSELNFHEADQTQHSHVVESAHFYLNGIISLWRQVFRN